jgi:hypothetical protein
MSVMTTIATRPGGASRYAGAPKLRLLPSTDTHRVAGSEPVAPRRAWRNHAVSAAAQAVAERDTTPAPDAPVLVAGRDASRRAAMIDEFGRTMAPGTKFVHVSAFWEVLALAGTSRMVIVSGDLDDVASGSLMRMLGHRYPALAVVALDVSETAHASA